MSRGNEDRSPIEQVLDLTFFGPVGLVLAARDAFPEWADEGRGRVVHQVEVAKMVGEHAARHGQKVAHDALVTWGILPGRPPPPRADVRSPTGPSANGGPPAPPEMVVEAAVFEADAVVEAELAIPGYDSLSAFQVVQRLAGLAPAELEAVRAYETASRGRRTILTKISQLQASRS